ncbi:MAG: hypothetical protein ACRDSP_17340 [Pseudonocardiaceae bacterium]
MAASHEDAQREARAGISAFRGAEGAGVLNRDPARSPRYRKVPAEIRSRADELDAEAAYYDYRATQEEQALGPGPAPGHGYRPDRDGTAVTGGRSVSGCAARGPVNDGTEVARAAPGG